MPCGGIPATYLNSQQSVEERKMVYRELAKSIPSCKLLYVTPEQLVKSGTLMSILQRLHERELLAAFVIDEVCCDKSPSQQFTRGLFARAHTHTLATFA